MSRSMAEEESEVAKASSRRLIERNKSLLESGKFADLELVCGNENFKVHKSIVCTGSTFFMSACREDAFKEGQQSTIRLEQDSDIHSNDPEVLRMVIEFLYCLDYNVNTKYEDGQTSLPTEDDRSLSKHAKLYAAADFYDIAELKDLSRIRFHEFLATTPATKDLAETIKVVYNSTPGTDVELRNMIFGWLLKAEITLLENNAIEAAIESIEKLPCQLFKGKAKASDAQSGCNADDPFSKWDFSLIE